MRSVRSLWVLAVFFAGLLPSSAQAALVTCPTSPTVTDRIFAVDFLSSGTATCQATGTGNNLTGGESDAFLDSIAGLQFFDYDSAANQTDNFYSFTIAANTTDLVTSVGTFTAATGTFTFGSTYTSPTNTTLYLGFKVGSVDPTWAVFALTGFTSGQALTGTWYTKPVQGGGISHSSIYGTNVPPDVTPDPVVPEPTSLLLLGSGLAFGGAAYRRRRNSSK